MQTEKKSKPASATTPTLRRCRAVLPKSVTLPGLGAFNSIGYPEPALYDPATGLIEGKIRGKDAGVHISQVSGVEFLG